MSEHLNMVTHLVERLHEGDRGSNPGRDRPKSLKQVTAILSSVIMSVTDVPCHSICRCGTLENPRYSIAMSEE